MAPPLKRLPWYTAVLVGQLQPFDRALLIIDQVVFEVPPELEKLRRREGEQRPVLEAPGHAFENDNEGFRATLEAALSGSIDLRALLTALHVAAGNGQRLVVDELLGRGASLTIRDPVHRATARDHARWAARARPSPERADVARVLEAATSAGW